MSNPLSAYFRQPVLYLPLPSRGLYWPDNSVDLSHTNELAVYSMTANDEIALKTPDALMNGSASVKVIESCIPQIKNAWEIPIIDLETIFIAIKIATNGNGLDIVVTCPNCDERNEYSINLQTLLNSIQVKDWSQSLTVDQLNIFFKPINFKMFNEFNNRLYRNQRSTLSLDKIEDIDQKHRSMNQLLFETNLYNLDYIKSSIHAIAVGDVTVQQQDHIREFIDNCDKKIYDAISDHLNQLKKSCKPSDISLVCEKCSFQFHSEINLDFASFFV